MTETKSMPIRISDENYSTLKEMREDLGGVGTATYDEVLSELIDEYDY